MIKYHNNILAPDYIESFNAIYDEPLIDSGISPISLKYPYMIDKQSDYVKSDIIELRKRDSMDLDIIINSHVQPDFIYYFTAPKNKKLEKNYKIDQDLKSYEKIGGILHEIFWEGRVFKLKHDLHLSVRYSENFWFHEYEELGIYAHGSTLSESIDSFQTQFDAAWTYYGEEDDDRLTVDAQDLKLQLNNLVISVTRAD